MTHAHWHRREVLTTLSMTAAAALLAVPGRPASAQGVKWSAGTDASKLKAPPNATDCHHHVYNAKFPVDPFARYCLLNGMDEMDFLLGQDPAISAFEASR